MFQTKRIKVKKKKEYIIVKLRPKKKEKISTRDIQFFQQNILQGIMQPQIVEKNRIVYVAPNGIKLKKYLKRGLSKQEFFQVFVQLLEVIRKIQCNSLDIKNLVLDLEYTFINENTKEIQVIYQPLISQQVMVSIFPYLYDVMHSTVFLISEEMQLVNELMGYMKRMQRFSAEEIEEYIEQVYPEIFKLVERYKAAPKEEKVLVNQEKKVTPKVYLTRVNTHDRIEINKSEFWIGKDPANVNYYLNNPSISRRHAVIRKRDRHFCIQDNHSTNKTMVNHRVLQAGQEVEIVSGDMIVLANEKFVFHADDSRKD